MDTFEKLCVVVAVGLMLFAGLVGEASAADTPVYSINDACSGAPIYTTQPQTDVQGSAMCFFNDNFENLSASGAALTGQTCTGGNDPVSGWCSQWTFDLRINWHNRDNPDTTGEYLLTYRATLHSSCPEGSIPDRTTGECGPPPEPEGPCTPDQGLSPQVGLVSSSGGSSTCFQGCTYSRDAGPSVCLEGDYCMGIYSLVMGAQCSESPDAAPDGCMSNGDVMFCTEDLTGEGNCGMINGEQVCLGDMPDGKCTFLGDGSYICDATSPHQPTTPDGTTPAAPDATGTSSDGDPWNYYGADTAGDSGSPLQGDGPPGSWGDEGDDQDDDGGTCDPDTEECDDEGSVSGGELCDVPPSCEGDPLQCAIVHQSWLERCADFEASDAEILEAAGLEPVGEGGFAVSNDVDVSAMLDDSGYGWSRTCFPDKVLLVPGFGEVVIPFSELCWLFQLVGNLIVMAAAYTSYRIVLGGNK